MQWFTETQQYLRVYVNNRNRLTTTSALCRWLGRIPYLRIVILDNDSTYAPLLQWYRKCPYRVIMLGQNLGHCALWNHSVATAESHTQLHFQSPGEWYAMTDSDVVPREDCPYDALQQMHRLMVRYPEQNKCGFSLELDDLPQASPITRHVLDWERQYWANLTPCGEGYYSGIDTTFALYSKRRADRWFNDLPWPHQGHQLDPAIRLARPYTARHIPWYAHAGSMSDEERYYAANASGVATWTHMLQRETK